MKVLIIGGYISKEKRGGAGNAVWEICKALSKTEDVYWLPLTSISDLPALFRKNNDLCGIKVIYKKFPFKVFLNTIAVFFCGGSENVSRYVDISSRRKYYATLYAYGKTYGEHIISDIKPDVVHIHGFSISSYPFFSAAINKGISVIGTAHGLYSLSKDIEIDYDRTIERDLMREIVKHGGAITSVSTKVKATIIKEFNISPNSVHVVLNGVDLDRFDRSNTSKKELRKKYGIPLNRKILLHVATLNKNKNHIEVLKALAHMDIAFRDALLYLVVGNGKEMDTLSGYVKENGLSRNVLFMGALYDTMLVDIYHLSDFFILSSTSEGFPLVFLEAMAAGLPIITFKDLEGVADICNPDCMELIQEKSIDSIINAIMLATEKRWDREKIKEIAKKCSWDYIGKEYITIYDMVTKELHLSGRDHYGQESLQ